MAKVYISEYREGAKEYASGTSIAAGGEPTLVEQPPITTTAGSAQSAAFHTAARLVRIHTDGIISLAFGSNPTATANSKRMAANTTEYFGVVPGHKVALITNT